MAKIKKKKRWVVKAGSQMVCQGGPLLLRSWAQQILQLRTKYGIEVIWVTSGAISTARDKLKIKNSKKNNQLSDKQALSAIGQPIIMGLYNMALQAEGLQGAQLLLTYDDLAHAQRRHNFKNTIETLLKWEHVPILNENDSISTEEIRFGDNDSLSARVAVHTHSDRLVILTDVQGLYDSNPTKNPKAQLLSSIKGVTAKTLDQPGLSTGNERGTGGMYSKLKAAQITTRKGIDTYLVKGDTPSVLLQLAQGVQLGTHIKA